MSKAVSNLGTDAGTNKVSEGLGDYVIRVVNSPLELDANQWNALLAAQDNANLFMRHEYLAAMTTTGCAVPDTGWTPCFVTIWQDADLAAACALYVKTHSYGEYVFDWAWANAYQQHGLDYYPKAVVGSPFSPVPGARLLARNAQERLLLAQALVEVCKQQKLSSLHILLGNQADQIAGESAGFMQRNTVQFHWTNADPHAPPLRGSLPQHGGESDASRGLGANFGLAAFREPLGGPAENCHSEFKTFANFLDGLAQEKRKKIRAERRKVLEAGVVFRWARGADISAGDWDFFYRCYERTYLEHGNAPYLSRAFFKQVASSLPESWLLFVGEVAGQPIAASLIGLDPVAKVAYGRYWGALKRVDCLHFEACYYQPLQWCIEHGFVRFEGGAQGEHKMARALLPVKTVSSHWLAHPSFADAVERFLEREGDGITHYVDDLNQRSPFRKNNNNPDLNPNASS